ncbi:MAG: metal ABC transporter permease [Candidatus Bathyarchaeia archaeon]
MTISTLEAFLSMMAQGFVQRAFVIGVIVAFLSSLLSVFIVLRKVSLIGDGLAHTAFGGLALGYYLDLVPLWVAGGVVVLGSIGITRAMRSSKISGDAAVAIFLQLGLASGIVLLSLARGFGVNLESLLFGSILLVSVDQIFYALLVLGATLTFIFLFYKELVYSTFDEVQAKASGIRTWFFDYSVSILAGIAIIVSIPIVGVLLISALLVLPAVTSVQLSNSLRQTVILSPVFGLLSVVLGLLASIILDTASGATIVLVGLAIFLLALFVKRIKLRIMSMRRIEEKSV